MRYKPILIDGLTINDHSWLEHDDECYYLMEYCKGHTSSEANSLINNLKKGLDRKGKPDWKYKEQAIQTAADYFKQSFKANILSSTTLIPIPPSKSVQDPLFDNRITQILQKLCIGIKADIRELIILKESIEPSHLSSRRLRPSELEEYLEINEGICEPEPTTIILFDDVITVGSHFKACKNLLKRRFPDVDVKGVFVARRKPIKTDGD